MASVLVAYASKYGSTQGVAEAIAAELREQGVDAVARPAGEVKDLAGYSAVVLGVALYFFHWMGEGHTFVKRNRTELAGLPMAVFGLGPIEDQPKQFTIARENLDKGLAKYPWLKPVSVEVFGGAVEPSKLRFPDNNPAFKAMPPTDLRDWEAIRAWARGLAGALGAAPTPHA